MAALAPSILSTLPVRRHVANLVAYEVRCYCRQSQEAVTAAERPNTEQQISKDGSLYEVSTAAVTMLFGSPLPHMPTSLHDSSAAHLSLSPNRGITHSGAFSPSPFHNLFQSPSGATLDDSPYQSLSHPPAKHSPVSAAAQHTAAQASRQAAAGQAQAQRGEQQSTTGAMDAPERTSAGMLVPVPAPSPLESKPQVTWQMLPVADSKNSTTAVSVLAYTAASSMSTCCGCETDSLAGLQVGYASADSGFVDRMPSFTSLVSGPPQKRQRCLQFYSTSDQENSSQEYSNQSPSASFSQEASHSNAAGTSQPHSHTVSASQSDQDDGPCSNDNESSREVSIKQEPGLTGSGRQAAQGRASSRHPAASSAALPALTAAMGSQMPNAARLAASQAAAAAAAVTPVTSRHVSSHSGLDSLSTVMQDGSITCHTHCFCAETRNSFSDVSAAQKYGTRCH